jgi:hypothetical protein
MDSRRRQEERAANEIALEFVRFCRRRRHVGWPELYDEMCLVASRGLFRGWGFTELAERGIEFGLAEMPRLAGLAAQIATDEAERRKRLMRGVMAPVALRPAAVPIRVAPEPADEHEDPPLLAVAN